MNARSRRLLQTLVTAALASTLTLLASAGGVAAEAAAPQAVPRNTSPPTISGTQRVGNTLTANPGTWSGTLPITFSYRWIRCSAQMSNCVNRTRGRRYTLGGSDLNRRLIVVVTARNAEGSGTAQASTGVIGRRATAPQNTIPPSIQGTPREGETLTANPGTWSGTGPISYGYQWLRCDANGGNCGAISGATARTYGPTAADVGRSLRVRVRASSPGGSRTLDSPPTSVVQPGGPGGQIRLPNGKVSIPIESVSLPTKLVIDQVRFSPRPVRSRTRPITVRVHVSDTRGFVVRGALVYLRSTPLVSSAPSETPTAVDGWATLVTTPRRPRPGLVFPLQRGLNVQFYVRARKSGERVLFGVTGTRLVQVSTAAPR